MRRKMKKVWEKFGGVKDTLYLCTVKERGRRKHEGQGQETDHSSMTKSSLLSEN